MFLPGLQKKSRIFWSIFIAFLVLAVAPVFVVFPQIKAEFEYWFSQKNQKEINPAGDLAKDENEGELMYTSIRSVDSDKDGLFDYLETGVYQTDPSNSDTDGDGFADGEEVIRGFDPRSHFASIIDTDLDALSDEQETNIFGTDPKNPDTDADGIMDGEEIASGSNPLSDTVSKINPDTDKYSLIIPEISVNAPIMFLNSRDEKDVLRALQDGVVHYAGTPIPGDKGDAVIFGHSSALVGSAGNYNTVFANLYKLERGDTFTIEGGNNKLKYRVTSVKVYDPTDKDIFRSTNRSTLTFITCYPTGSNRQRLIVRAEKVL